MRMMFQERVDKLFTYLDLLVDVSAKTNSYRNIEIDESIDAIREELALGEYADNAIEVAINESVADDIRRSYE